MGSLSASRLFCHCRFMGLVSKLNSSYCCFYQNLVISRNKRNVTHFDINRYFSSASAQAKTKIKIPADPEPEEPETFPDTKLDKNPEVQEQDSNVKNVESLDDWTAIYKFRHIVSARAVQRVKLYQTVFTTGFALPFSLVANYWQLVDNFGVVFCMGTSILACGMLYLVGNFASRLIGFIYTSPSAPKTVRVAHLTFWGHRRDQYLDVEDFVHIGDLPDDVRNPFIILRLYSDQEEKFYISLRYGDVYNPEEFVRVFGNAPGLVFRKPVMKKSD